jgi:hypothetical protein
MLLVGWSISIQLSRLAFTISDFSDDVATNIKSSEEPTEAVHSQLLWLPEPTCYRLSALSEAE